MEAAELENAKFLPPNTLELVLPTYCSSEVQTQEYPRNKKGGAFWFKGVYKGTQTLKKVIRGFSEQPIHPNVEPCNLKP